MTRTALAVLALASWLCACASPPPDGALPRLGPEDTDPALGYEQPPVLRAGDVLQPELARGPHHRVRDDVGSDGFLRLYTIDTDWGTIEAAGDVELRLHVQAIRSIAALDAVAEGRDFEAARERAVAEPFVARFALVEEPVTDLHGMPPAAWEEVLRIAAVAPDRRSADESGVRAAALAFGAAKRQIARRLGVSPYAPLAPLQRELNRVAWAVSAGGLEPARVPALAESSVAPRPEDIFPAERLAELYRSDSPEDLRRHNRIELSVMGVPADVMEQFLSHAAYSPREQTGVVESLVLMEPARDRGEYVRVALRAGSRRDAWFYLVNSAILSFHHHRVAPLERLIALDGRVAAAYTRERRLIVPAAVDELLWTRPVERFAQTLASTQLPGEPIEARELWLSGSLSPTARSHLEALGIRVVEDVFARVFQRLEPPPQ